MYIYPDNLKAAPTLWLWRLRDLTAGGLLAVFGVVTLTQFRTPLFAAIAALYLFLTIRFEDACILDFIRKAGVYFIGRPRLYRWVYGDNISEKRGKGRDWRGQVWKRPDFRRVCGGTAPEQGRDVAVILRKTASAAVGAFFAPRKAPGGPTNGVAGNDAQTYESPQKRRRQAISGGLWYKMSRMASSRKSQQQTLEDEPPGP